MTQFSSETAISLVYLLLSQLWLIRNSEDNSRWSLFVSLLWFVAYVLTVLLSR